VVILVYHRKNHKAINNYYSERRNPLFILFSCGKMRVKQSKGVCTATLSLQVLLPFLLSALMMGLIGMGNNPEAHATVACAVAVYNAMK